MQTTLVSPNTASATSAQTTPSSLPVWPLPATQIPNGHLTWAEWCARQAAAEHIMAAERIVRAAREPIAAGV